MGAIAVDDSGGAASDRDVGDVVSPISPDGAGESGEFRLRTGGEDAGRVLETLAGPDL